MSDLLTICYITGRLEPRFEWFADSLHRETGGDYTGISVLVVDYWADGNGEEPGAPGPTPEDRRRYFTDRLSSTLKERFLHVPPKPTVWQGRHRLTKKNYFAAANARNTGVLYAEDGWIAYADDEAILMPGWLATVRQAQRENFIALGCFRKADSMVVEKGELVSMTIREAPPYGTDSRWHVGSDQGWWPVTSPGVEWFSRNSPPPPASPPVTVSGGFMYGCSVAMPVEALLRTNGWEERADANGIGTEDYLTGMILDRHGYTFRYCLGMFTIEQVSTGGSNFARDRMVRPGRLDSAHIILALVRDPNCTTAPNYFEEGGIRALRARVLAGEKPPVLNIPEHCWYSGTLLRDL